MTKQLTKESLFAYRVLQRAAQKAGGYPIEAGGKDSNIIVAGGAIRDLHFGRESRDLDVYYDVTRIGTANFANALKRLDAGKMAREFGFESIEIVRLSDSTRMGTGGEGEDWGDVDDNVKAKIDLFISYINHFMSTSNVSFNAAVLKAHAQVPNLRDIFLHKGAEYEYARQQLSAQGIANISPGKQTGSGSGNKQGKAHPLKSIEEFEFIFNGDRWGALHVELMAVDQEPAKYVMEQFAVKLSRAYYDGHGIHFTPDFMQDARNKTITVACPIEHARFERLFSYYLPKMKKYFPDFEIRVDLDAMNRTGW